MAISQNFPTSRPSLSLNFARSKILDPRITFTRSSSATYVDENGIIQTAGVDVARFDHDPVTGESLGLLIEESRTNYHLNYSNNLFQMAYSNWTSDSSITYPNGGTVGGYNTFNQLSGSRFFLDYNPAGNNTYTCSVYARLKPGSTATTIYINVKDWQTDTIRGSSPIVTLTNQWQRITATGTTAGSTAGLRFEIFTNASGSSAQIYLWGAQVEVGSFASSYIPTIGSQVTRTSEFTSVGGTSFSEIYNPYEGTYIIDYRRGYAGTNTPSYNFPGLLYSYSLLVFSVSQEGEYVKNQNVNAQQVVGTATTSSFRKMGIFYDSTSYGGCISGGNVVVGGGAFSTTQDTSITFGFIQGTTQHRIKTLAYYPKRLTNAQLQELTK